MRAIYRTRLVKATRKKTTRALVTWELLLSCGHMREFSSTKSGAPKRVRCFECGQRDEWKRENGAAADRGAS
jgi:hypothetical protein